jgi:serine/threonine-protein kinase RsbW
MNKPAQADSAEKTSVVELRIPGEAEWVAVARLTAAAIASRLDFSLDEIDDLKLAVAEACTNAIRRGAESAPIDLIFTAQLDSIVVTVRDLATSSHLESVDDDNDPERIEGLGLFIIRSLMDDVDFRVDPKTGGELVMTKRVFA